MGIKIACDTNPYLLGFLSISSNSMILSSFFSISIERLLLIEELISNLRMNSVKDTTNRAIRPILIIRYTIEVTLKLSMLYHSTLFYFQTI